MRRRNNKNKKLQEKMASAADLVPAVEAYLEANGLTTTLSAMQAESKAKKMTPSKKVS